MEKVLIVAYQFPPMGGPGVHRSLNLVTRMRAHGFEPVVLTIDDESMVRGGHTIDRSLLAQLPEGLTVIRTPSHEPVSLRTTLMKARAYRVFWFFLFPLFWEKNTFWARRVLPVAEQVVRTHNIRLVYTSSGPFSSLKIGKHLKEKLRLRWVADLRDPFTDAYFWSFPSKLHWKLARKAEKAMLELPDTLIVNTDAVKRLYDKRGIRKNKNTVVVNNGY